MTFIHLNKNGYGKNYSVSEINNYLMAQIDNSIEYGWRAEDIIVATNFPFEYLGIKNVYIKSICNNNKYYNKFYSILELFENGHITENIWFHDLDSWQINQFDFPLLPQSDFGVCGYMGNENVNTANLFFTPEAGDIIRYFVDHMKTTFNQVTLTDHVSDENVVNFCLGQLYDMGCERIQRVSCSYNIGFTFFEERLKDANNTYNVIGVKPDSERELKKFDFLIPDKLRKHFNTAKYGH